MEATARNTCPFCGAPITKKTKALTLSDGSIWRRTSQAFDPSRTMLWRREGGDARWGINVERRDGGALTAQDHRNIADVLEAEAAEVVRAMLQQPDDA